MRVRGFEKARSWSLLVFALMASAVIMPRADAAAIGLDSTQIPILIGAADFDIAPGFSSNVTGTDGTFSGSWFSPGPDISGSGIIYFVDAGNIVRDILSITFSNSSNTAQISGTYQSHLASSNLVPAGFTGVQQSPSTLEVEGMFADPSTAASVVLPGALSVFVNTETSSATPEPAALTLAGLGLALLCLGLVRRVSAQPV